MAQIYGGRWKTIRSIGKGGQGDVFEVQDLRNPDAGSFALKRVRNPNRRHRFEAEINAIGTLDHPNIIRLIDHSALNAESGSDEKQYMVMPIAAGGDLTSRVKGYRASLDSTLAVASPLASALSAAHTGGIIHRDIKPGNVLFADAGNAPWLSDFGICLIRDAVRLTEIDEVAGPWAFMAPETEYGGQLEVTAAADIYSLGKLIYYMVSGGTVLPRERLSEERYAAIFSQGGRYHLLELLLRRMICEAGNRIQSMAVVEQELQRIADWDSNSVAPPFSQAGRSRIEALQRSAVESRRVVEAEISARQASNANAEAILEQLKDFVKAELEKAAIALGEGGAITATVRDVQKEDLGYINLQNLSAAGGFELAISGVSATRDSIDVLQLLICRRSGLEVSFRPAGLPAAPQVPPEVNFVVVPRCTRLYRKGTFSGSRPLFFLAQPGQLMRVPDPPRPGQRPSRQVANVPGYGQMPAKVFAMEIASSGWPQLATQLATFIMEVCDNFLIVLQRNKDSSFLV